jgi:hypothetical protein
MQKHYPERVAKILVVNVPFWMGSSWSMVAGILPKSVQARIELSSNTSASLRKYIPVGSIPRDFQGESPKPLGESDEEALLKRLVGELGGAASSGSALQKTGGQEPQRLSPSSPTSCAPGRQAPVPVSQSMQRSGPGVETAAPPSPKQRLVDRLSWLGSFKTRPQKVRNIQFLYRIGLAN